MTEADLFASLNTNQKKVGAFDLFKSEVAAGRADAVAVDRAVTRLGLNVTRQRVKNGVCAIAAARQVHNRRANLEDTLGFLKSWGDDDPCTYDGDLIRALSLFLYELPTLDSKRLTFTFNKTTPEAVIIKIKRLASFNGVERADCYRQVLCDVYNSKRGVKKITPFMLKNSEVTA